MGKDPLQKKSHTNPHQNLCCYTRDPSDQRYWQFGTASTSKEHFNSLKTNGLDANGKKVYSLRPQNNVHFTFQVKKSSINLNS